MRAITLRRPRGASGLPARIGSTPGPLSVEMRDLGGTAANLPASTRAEIVLAAHPTTGLPKRRLRIPDHVLVSLTGCATPEARSLLAAPAASANDNGARRAPAAVRARNTRRELVLLAMLVASLAGAYWQGRMQGYQKIIVVPGPSLPGSKVT